MLSREHVVKRIPKDKHTRGYSLSTYLSIKINKPTALIQKYRIITHFRLNISLEFSFHLNIFTSSPTSNNILLYF